MHVASPIKMPTTHYNGRVGGGGGGGGGGGKGGQGGSGGHNGGRRCNGGFCWNTHQYCNGDGGSGGAGGAGGAGGRGNGYYYDYANGIWQRVNNNSNIGASGAGVLKVEIGEQRKEAQVVREAKEEDLNKVEIMEIQVILAVQERVSMVVVGYRWRWF